MLYLSKVRPDKGRERRVTHLDQQLPQVSEWNDFLTNESNKLQLTQHLADSLLLDESTLGRDVFVTVRGICVTAFRQNHNQSHVQFSYHREAVPRVVADDTDVFILLLIVADKAIVF